MAGSPFAGKGGAAAVKTPPAAASPANDGVSAVDVADVGKDPFDVANPSGISDQKALYFLDQLVMFHATEYGSMATIQSTAEKPESEFVRVDFIALTAPDQFTFVNGQGVTEECEPYEVSQRFDDVLVFNAALVNEGRKSLEKGIEWKLGRIAKGTARPGRNAPLLLVEASPEDKAYFQQWKTTPEARKAILG
jgi:hypothetical protein